MIGKFDTPKFVPPKEIVVTWNTFRKGLNLLLRENEIDPSEMVQCTNLMLIGSGIPTKRWGTKNVSIAGATGSGRFLMPIKSSSDEVQVLALTDWGRMVKMSGASYTMLTGASWPSGYNVEGAQLGGKVYFVSSNREMVKYDFSTLTSFVTIAKPTGLAASLLSTVSGTNQWSWKITASSNSGGETLASTNISLASLPQDMTKTTVRLEWTPVSAASGVLTGYNIYKGTPGDEYYIGSTGSTATTYLDTGNLSPDMFRTVPTYDTTGGLKAKYIIRFQDRLVLAGIPGSPTMVVISGRYPQQESFAWGSGGGSVMIEPDSGENITGLSTYYSTSSSNQTVIVFKEKSVWEMRIDTIDYGQVTLLNPTYRLLTASQGCSSHRTIKAVENDIMFANRKGVYILRYEPQLTNVINANEISAKIRPFFESLSDEDFRQATAVYADKKYILSYPISKQTIVFDRERLSFVGPWPTPYGINHWANYIDADGNERWIAVDSDDNMITEFKKAYNDDKGQPINTVFKSKREDFGDWTIFKTINEIFMNFRNVFGSISVNIYIEDRSGKTVITKAFTITPTGNIGTSGIGTDKTGTSLLGSTRNKSTVYSEELPKKAFIYKSSRIVQVEIKTTSRTAGYELLGVKVIGIPQSRGNSPSNWSIT